MTSDGPRAPENHDLTGTGTPRSADNRVLEPGTGRREEPADEGRINRSGSGGSGGPTTEDEQESSTPASMEELLTGEDAASGTTD